MPCTVLIHEIGHAFGLLLSTKTSIASVYLGDFDKSNKENFRIGRMHFHIRWGYVGFCAYENEAGQMSNFQIIVFMLCGPLMSLFVSLILTLILFYFHVDGSLNSLITGAAIFNFFQFMWTIIPMKYPAWMKAYAGMPSDGYQVLQVLKGNK